MGRLQDKVALITGGGAGIGAATARLFCAEGAAVVLVDANAEALARTEQAIAAGVSGARIACFHADVANEDAAAGAVRHGIDAYGRLDILVNNASMRNYTAVADATADEWHAVASVNLIAASVYSKAALPFLRRAGRASIVNVSSVYAVAGRKGMAIYDSTKAGLLALTRALAFEEAPHGVRANAVCPGSTLTDFHLNKARASGVPLEQLKTERYDRSLIGRWAEPAEIGWPILWLASDEASFITGTTLMVDGGLSIM
ncbi:MAG TPA: SDR family oxidoreductase [Burkholderiales bacterium]|nr:SDR family oxidoreductase [Burkholderiales bacterium]